MPQQPSLLDQLEEWLEAQVPTNLHELPNRMLETMERISNELFETLNMHGPPSISIPFPPFAKAEPPPPPPVVPPLSRLACGPWTKGCSKAGKLVKGHPYLVGAGAVLAVGVGLGMGRVMYRKGFFNLRRVWTGTRATVSEGMLKDAIVILAPSPLPPLLWPLAVSLLRAGYVVIIAVPHVDDAEQLEKRLSGVEEKNALRVLIYDAEDPATFPPFHRSLLATLTLRFPALDSAPDPYKPDPDHLPHIHAYISLYPLNPNPSSQPSALPALPTLLAPANGSPKLITIYPSTSTLVQPDSFASQILTANHQLLAKNLGAFSNARSVSVYIGDIYLPRLHTMILGGGQQVSRRQQAQQQLAQATAVKKVSLITDYIYGYLTKVFNRIAAYSGFGSAGREYELFEQSFLRLLRNDWRTRYHLGQYSYLALFLSRLPAPLLPRLLPVLPLLPGATGPLSESVQGLPTPRKPLGRPARSTRTSPSLSSSDHERESEGDGLADDYMASSLHTTGASSSTGRAESQHSTPSSGASGAGLGDSWVGLDAAV